MCVDLLLSLTLLFCVEGEVVALGGILLSVQSKVSGLDDPKNVSWKHGCSGIPLKPRMALTCASCLVYEDERLGYLIVQATDLRLYDGDKDPNDADNDKSAQTLLVEAILIHPDYFFKEQTAEQQRGPSPNEFDFAILVTKTPFSSGGHMKAVPLYSTDTDINRELLKANGTECSTMTWYFYMDGRPVTDKPEAAEIPVVLEPLESCRNLSDALAHPSGPEALHPFSCVKGSKLPVCRVDTGSPILCGGKLVALVVNSRLDCDKDEGYALIAGINNAMSFLTKPDLYHFTRVESSQLPLTTQVERARSSLARLSTVVALLRLGISSLTD